MNKIRFAFLLLFLLSCNGVGKTFSDYLRHKRIDAYLADKDQSYIDKYKSMAFYTTENENFYLTYYWKDEVSQKKFETSPCVRGETKKINIEGQAFDRFHKMIDHAIKNDFNAFKFQDNSKATHAKVRFYRCAILP